MHATAGGTPSRPLYNCSLTIAARTTTCIGIGVKSAATHCRASLGRNEHYHTGNTHDKSQSEQSHVQSAASQPLQATGGGNRHQVSIHGHHYNHSISPHKRRVRQQRMSLPNRPSEVLCARLLRARSTHHNHYLPPRLLRGAVPNSPYSDHQRVSYRLHHPQK